MNPERFFTTEQRENISSAIAEAELDTSGEIRVHIEDKMEGDVLDRAAYIFAKLDMHKTKLRNGVLFYLAIDSRKFAILGDAGINAKVPENFWDSIRETMAGYFREGDFTTGLTEGILMAGKELKSHFPYRKDDVNELSDEVSFGKN